MNPTATRSSASPAALSILVALGILVALALIAPPAAQAQVMDGIVDEYRGASSQWLERMLPIAQGTFAILAAIEFAVSGIVWGLRRESLDQMMGQALKKFLLLSFLFALISAFPLFVPNVIHGFEVAGQRATGFPVVNPTHAFGLGQLLSGLILVAAYDSLGGSLLNLPAALLGVLAALLVLLAFASIAAQLVLVLVESTIVLTGGVIFLGFAGFRGTAGFADGYLRWTFHVGIKIFFLYLLVGVGLSLAIEWITDFPQSHDLAGFQAIFEILGGSFVFALLVWRIPNAVATHLAGNASFRLQEALGDHG